MDSFGGWVRARRTELLLTQEQLADAAGLSVRTVRNLEAGRGGVPRLETQRLLIAALGGEPSAGERPAVPAQLPADVANFVGRAQVLGQLDAVRQGPIAICGTAGVGKTALAVHWAYRVRHRFPGGQLYVDLRGFAPGSRPLRPIEALARFLRALGVAADGVPADVDDAAGLYRTLLADRRVLVVLDNAADADQVRPLLPGGDANLAVVTSRDQLNGLIARDGATRIGAEALDDREAYALLERIVGPQRVAAERVAAQELAARCAHLPLALRIAATNLQGDGQQTIADYAARIREDAMAALAVEGDRESAVRAAFDLSYLALPERAQILFRRLGLVPGGDVSAETATVVAGCRPADAVVDLRLLVRSHLVEPRADGRFGLHDLLRQYARERAAEADDPDAVLSGLLDHYLSMVDAAARLLYPHMIRLPGPDPGRPLFAGPAQASAWLDTERPGLVAAVLAGPRPATWLLADALRGYFVSRMHVVDWSACAEAALAAARAESDFRGQAAAHLSLATLHSRLGDQIKAINGYAECLRLARDAGWEDGEIAALGSLGNAYFRRGLPDQAARYFTEVLGHARRAGRLATQATSLANLGVVSVESGRLTEAAEQYAEALELSRKVASPSLEANALASLGGVHHLLGRFDLADDELTEAMDHHRRIGDRDSEVFTLCHLAALYRDRGDYARACDLAEQALALSEAAGHRRYEIEVLNTLATIAGNQGLWADGVRHARKAVDRARETGYRFAEAVGLTALGFANHCLGDPLGVQQLAQAVHCAQTVGARVPEGNALTSLASATNDAQLAREAVAVLRPTGHLLGVARALIIAGDQAEAMALFSGMGAAEAHFAGRLPGASG
jgi:tetratricopeptide (TPR) repeat protein/transcriptional regulator with XRE-family HTH domain